MFSVIDSKSMPYCVCAYNICDQICTKQCRRLFWCSRNTYTLIFFQFVYQYLCSLLNELQASSVPCWSCEWLKLVNWMCVKDPFPQISYIYQTLNIWRWGNLLYNGNQKTGIIIDSICNFSRCTSLVYSDSIVKVLVTCVCIGSHFRVIT